MKTIITSLTFSLWCLISTAQTTAIPDSNFEQLLIDLEIDSDGTVNGQILTTDALEVTNLVIQSTDYNHLINDLTGLEAFTNIDTLRINVTMAEDLHISTLTNLKYLNCADNMLTSVDVSNNTLLEYLDITSDGDVIPFNLIDQIDLSGNPNIKWLIATGPSYINLKNGNNNPNLRLTIPAGSQAWGAPEDVIFGNTCIEVDDVESAQTNQFPYSKWNIYHPNQSYSFSENCNLSTPELKKKNTLTLYPNPATNVVNITSSEPVTEATIYNLLGQKVKQLPAGSTTLTIDVSSLTAGTYFVVVKTDKGSKTDKLIIK